MRNEGARFFPNSRGLKMQLSLKSVDIAQVSSANINSIQPLTASVRDQTRYKQYSHSAPLARAKLSTLNSELPDF